MSLLGKLRDAATLPPDTDLLAYLGWKPGDHFAVGRDGVTVGGETVPLADARAALNPPIPTAEPRRSVAIGDL